MKKSIFSGIICTILLHILTGCSQKSKDPDAQKKDSVIVAMGPTSEPESGFDPTYGWGAESMCTNR